MPAAIKRRKVTATSKNASSPNTRSRGIEAFARVSKASSTQTAGTEKKDYDTIAITPYSTTEKKRKLDSSDEESTAEQASTPLSAIIKHRDIKPLPPRRSQSSQLFPQTPHRPLLKAGSSTDTPTNGARTLFEHLLVSSKPPAGSSSLSSDSPPSPPPAKLDPPKPTPASAHDLPTELLDLINLHAAFLTALSLYYAHNGAHSPADLRILCTDVARVWGKRQVTLEDIRRSLGVTNSGIPEDTNDRRISRLGLSDYGHGKICIEIKSVSGKAGRLARPVNEVLLNEIFVRELKTSWDERRASGMEAMEFIGTLPLEPITTCSSLVKMSPLLAKGQRRLDYLRSGITVKKEAAKEKLPVETSNGTKPTLLERLRAKQLHQSTLPAAPSKAEIARKAALQRIEEVVAVLSILSTSTSIGQQRISFTLPTVLGRLCDSFKTPISKEEGATCVRLLASEIAPEWVRIVKMGKVEALVVNRDARPTELDIKERVKRAA